MLCGIYIVSFPFRLIESIFHIPPPFVQQIPPLESKNRPCKMAGYAPCSCPVKASMLDRAIIALHTCDTYRVNAP